MKIAYEPNRLRASSLEVVAKANVILADYAAQGFDLTLRQLYYQFVSRGWVPNKDTEYKRLGSIINDARLCGLIDWNSIVDRTRFLRSLSHWPDPSSLMRSALASFAHDKWEDQDWHVEVWIEKDALVGVIEGVCSRHDVGYFSCRGYTSQSEMWRAAQRLGEHIDDGKEVRIIHLGDHDPSGIDMTRDITERIENFIYGDGRDGDKFHVERVALTMDQIEQYDPPPNPAKLTDSRGAGYVDRYGYESWELDALEPTVIATLIEEAILEVRDFERWDEAVAEEERQKVQIRAASDRWTEVVAFLGV